MLLGRGFFFALYKRQKTKKPPESLATRPSDDYRVQNKNASIVSILTFLYGGAHETQTPGSTLSAVQIDIRERKFCIKPVSLGAYYVHEESSCSLCCVVVAIQL